MKTRYTKGNINTPTTLRDGIGEGIQPLLPASTELAGKTSLYAQRWGERNNGMGYTQYGDKVSTIKFNSIKQ